MNHLILTAVLTACLGIGGYQQGLEFFGPSPEGLGHDPHFDPGQLNSSNTDPWPPLVSPHSTMSIVVYTTLYYVLTYFGGNFGRYNIYAKVFRWLMTIYPIITALTGFQFVNLSTYILQVVPIISGYYTRSCSITGIVLKRLLCLVKCHKNPNYRIQTPGSCRLSAYRPGCPRFLGLKSEMNSTSEKFPRLTTMESSTSKPCLQKDPVSSSNENSDPNNYPEITGATANGELKKLPQERGPQRMINPATQKGNLSLLILTQPMKNLLCEMPTRVA
ncbi:hypothetical protein DSO57_1021458 [Entomophthora muscae]|uniref:Uncharacterized protein n=1 Tax=Entomophthora muscae TaxID=34485 RepID=A0ACC2TFF2_9FUNG|nr:hypothetical protein DSO57_1021458 [Entomophthora muscae]